MVNMFCTVRSDRLISFFCFWVFWGFFFFFLSSHWFSIALYSWTSIFDQLTTTSHRTSGCWIYSIGAFYFLRAAHCRAVCGAWNVIFTHGTFVWNAQIWHCTTVGTLASLAKLPDFAGWQKS